MCGDADRIPGWRASSRSARSAAPPVAHRMNSSVAASNESIRALTSSRSAFHDGNPCSRAITDCASCKARPARSSSPRGVFANAGSAAKRRSAAGSCASAAWSNDLACFFSCSRFGRSGRWLGVIHPPCSACGSQPGGTAAYVAVGLIGKKRGLGPSREPAGAV